VRRYQIGYILQGDALGDLHRQRNCEMVFTGKMGACKAINGLKVELIHG
jgi:hypothetical protein